MLIVSLTLGFLASVGQAEVYVIPQPDGSSARITDLGNGIGIMSDPHGNTNPMVVPPHLQTDPVGERDHQTSGTMTPFGSPTPPNNLTPAPVLPFNPNRSLAPIPSLPPAITPSPVPSSGMGSSMGRFGR